jgi:hypothetical protein
MLLALLASPPPAAAQQDRGAEAAREQAFIENLRREDPASADRFIALREAQQQAIAELRRKEGQVSALPPQLRGTMLPQLKQAQRTYVDSQLKILDFLDEHDRRVLARLQEDITQLNRALEDRRRARDELKKLLAD